MNMREWKIKLIALIKGVSAESWNEFPSHLNICRSEDSTTAVGGLFHIVVVAKFKTCNRFSKPVNRKWCIICSSSHPSVVNKKAMLGKSFYAVVVHFIQQTADSHHIDTS